MAEESAIAVIIKMVTTLGGDAINTMKSMTGLFRELLEAMGGVFGAGGLSAYIGAAIVLVVAILLVKFFLSESKLILTLVGIVVLIFLLIVVL
jgi:hypothetical protein